MKICKALLGKGYFPRELPPVFSTTDFGSHADEIIGYWIKHGIFTKKENGEYKLKFAALGAESELISIPKRGYERRDIHITHPLPQALLCKELAENWDSIEAWLSKQKYTEDKIEFNSNLERGRSIRGIDFRSHNQKKLRISSTSNWIVKTDITRFYSSIYTHSIAWGAYGKEKAKENMNSGENTCFLADTIDSLVRLCNRKQTIGIPTGPDTSRIISEIISSRIDFELNSEFIDEEKIDRLQDDWVIGVSTLEEAEEALSIVSRLYRSFGLEINGSKTSIDQTAFEYQEAWLSELDLFLPQEKEGSDGNHEKEVLTGERLRGVLDLCLRLQSKNRSEPVVNYVLKSIRGIIDDKRGIARGDISTLKSFFLKAAVAAPITLDRISRMILKLERLTGREISKKIIGERFNQLAEVAVTKGHTFEVLWFLYTLRGLEYGINVERICEVVESEHSSAIALILLDMNAKGLIRQGRLPIDKWQDRITEESVNSDWTWLLAYEGFRNGWLRDKNNLMEQPLFKPMVRHQVKFYDPEAELTFPDEVTQKMMNVVRIEDWEIEKMPKNKREEDFWY